MDKVLEMLKGWDASHVLALINQVGGREIAFDIAAGRKKVVVEDVIQFYFDQSGRAIPLPGMNGITDVKRSFYFSQPRTFNYSAIITNLQELFGPNFRFISADEFEKKCIALARWIKDNPLISNILKGPHFPFVIPQLVGDCGQQLDDVIIPVLELSYQAHFPKRMFTNFYHGDLAKKVTVVDGTRQERLVKAMALGSACGWYFPEALQGFGIETSRELISYLPEELILSGMEVPIVVATFPDVFIRNCKTPSLEMAALLWKFPRYPLGFMTFEGEAHFGVANFDELSNCTGGLSILG